MLGTLFVSTGTILLTAGDEFGRSQGGNNNAYAQDNPITWVDWDGRDRALEAHVFALAGWRATRISHFTRFDDGGAWTDLDGEEMTALAWESTATQGFRWAGKAFGLKIDRTGPGAGPA